MDVKKYIGINPQLYVIILKELGNKRFSNVLHSLSFILRIDILMKIVSYTNLIASETFDLLSSLYSGKGILPEDVTLDDLNQIYSIFLKVRRKEELGIGNEIFAEVLISEIIMHDFEVRKRSIKK